MTMPNCLEDISFSSTHAKKRWEKAASVLGKGVLTRLMAFALFLLGAKREDIARFVQMPLGTLLSFLTRMNSDGVVALQDRRGTPVFDKPLPQHPKTVPRCSVKVSDEGVVVSCAPVESELVVPRGNWLQCRTVLLTFMTAGLLRAEDVADAVALSKRRVRQLADAMRNEDAFALMDKRQGQQKDYVFTSEVKSELVQQFATNALTGRQTSGRAIAQDVRQRCNMDLADRSVRLHLKKLGLPRIAKSLPELVEAQKKSSSKS